MLRLINITRYFGIEKASIRSLIKSRVEQIKTAYSDDIIHFLYDNSYNYHTLEIAYGNPNYAIKLTKNNKNKLQVSLTQSIPDKGFFVYNQEIDGKSKLKIIAPCKFFFKQYYELVQKEAKKGRFSDGWREQLDDVLNYIDPSCHSASKYSTWIISRV